jgi:pilus assembly protein Flp/PilA
MHLVKEPKMINIQRKVIVFLNDENGPTAVEYAVMVALIIVVSIAAITTLGTKVSSTFSNTTTKITTGTAAS